MSFPCCLVACLRPSLSHAVQTYSQRQNKFPNDKFCSTYRSSKVKYYQTGIIPKILAKKETAAMKAKKARGSKRNQPTAVPLTSARSAPAAAFALVSLSFHPDFSKFFQPRSTRTPLSPLLSHSRERSSYCVLCQGATIPGEGGWLKNMINK